MQIRSLAVAGLVAFLATSSAWGRTWSDSTGKYRLEAEFVELNAGVVKLKRNDGKVIEVPLAKLSEADQELIQKSTAKPADTKKAAPAPKIAARRTASKAKPKPQPPANLDPELAKQFMTQIFFKSPDKVSAMLATEPGLVNCDLNGETPLIKACSAESMELVQLLVEAGADVQQASSSGNTSLLDAVMRKDLKIVQYLIDQGADPIAPAGEGYTPLHRAATKEIAELLLSLKADLKAVTEHNDTPLHTALEMGFLEVAEYLIEQGADIEAIGNWDATPLHVVCKTPMGDAKAMAEMLIKHKANVHALGFLNSTVIHQAAFYDKPALVELFATQGVDINAKNRNGRTALSLAQEGNYQPRIDLLKKLGAKE